MKKYFGIVIFFLFYSHLSHATCMAVSLSCNSEKSLSVSYELLNMTCSAPGGPVSETKTLTISHKILGVKELVEVADLTFALQDDGSDSIILEVSDSRTELDDPENISTDGPKVIIGYTCTKQFH